MQNLTDDKLELAARDLKSARKVFSRVGLALTLILVVASAVQIAWMVLPNRILGSGNWFTGSSWGMWLGTFVPIYLIAVPLGLLLLRKLPANAPQEHKLEAKAFFILFPVAYFMMYAGNILGTVLSAVFSGGTATNALMDYAMDTNPLKILVMVILAPLIEEYVFRKQIIDRTAKYGEKLSVFLSGIVFGLFHLNLFQFFYAFFLGLLLGYLYIRTGRLRYPVILHAIINFLGSVVAPFILSLIDLNALTQMDPNTAPEQIMALYSQMLPGLIVYMLYAMLLTGISIAGLVLLIVKFKSIEWNDTSDALPKGQGVKTAYCNVGMIIYIIFCLIMIVFALL